MTELFPLTPAEWETLLWYLWHGGIAFLVVLGATAVLEHYLGREWPFE